MMDNQQMLAIDEMVKNSRIQITDNEFRKIRNIVFDNFGISLTEQKRSLVVGRLHKLLRKHNLPSFESYCKYVLADKTGAALSELANHISTNHTFFFRENDHFVFFKNTVLPELEQKHKAKNCRDMRIWCAASSSGEEPYTILMTLMEYFGREYDKWDAGLLATDISEKALTTAARGIYPEERIAGIPPALLKKYFVKNPSGGVKVADKMRKEVLFRRFNLMNKKFTFKKQFDVIFCRNVMIYFEQDTRDELVNKMYDITVPGGYLFIGHSESLGRGRTPWKYVMPAVYRKDG